MSEKRFTVIRENLFGFESLWDCENNTEKPLLSFDIARIRGIDECCDLLNELNDENEELKETRNYYHENYLTMKTERNYFKGKNEILKNILENQSLIIQELGAKLLEYETEEPITLTKEDLEVMGKALSYYIHEGGLND